MSGVNVASDQQVDVARLAARPPSGSGSPPGCTGRWSPGAASANRRSWMPVRLTIQSGSNPWVAAGRGWSRPARGHSSPYPGSGCRAANGCVVADGSGHWTSGMRDVTHPRRVSADPREPSCPLDHLPWRSLQGNGREEPTRRQAVGDGRGSFGPWSVVLCPWYGLGYRHGHRRPLEEERTTDHGPRTSDTSGCNLEFLTIMCPVGEGQSKATTDGTIPAPSGACGTLLAWPRLGPRGEDRGGNSRDSPAGRLGVGRIGRSGDRAGTPDLADPMGSGRRGPVAADATIPASSAEPGQPGRPPDRPGTRYPLHPHQRTAFGADLAGPPRTRDRAGHPRSPAMNWSWRSTRPAMARTGGSSAWSSCRERHFHPPRRADLSRTLTVA